METLKNRKVAYFSMEIGLLPEFHTYSGGLGVLAGDTVRSSADLKIPLLAVTLVNRMGYFRQELSPGGKQVEHPDPWTPETLLKPMEQQVEVDIEGRKVKIRAWLYESRGTTGGVVPVIFLDTETEANAAEDRAITSYLYGGDDAYRLKQEIVLGIGGARLLRALGIEVNKYHLNEGHASLLTVELLRISGGNVEEVRHRCLFTTHTPVEAGHDKFPYDLVNAVLPELIPLEVLKQFGGREHLNMTFLALNLSGYINGVAKKHRETAVTMFPGYTIRSITNGVHSYTWTHPAFRSLYDKHFQGWANEPELLVRAQVIPDEEVRTAHSHAKGELLQYVNKKGIGQKDLAPDVFTIGFARRATRYKRHTLIFSDVNRLRRITRKHRVQIIFAGKAHPKDEHGKQMIEELFRFIEALHGDVAVAYLENYDMTVAAQLVAGVDLWLNTPLSPFEASGTSGMKAAHNGVLNFSVLDGWWAEGCIEGLTGWAIGPSHGQAATGLSLEELSEIEREDLYGKLEYVILPLFYNNRDRWTELMQESIAKIAYYFNSHRMMRRYISEAYFD
jgi:starch phosphorylase